MSASGGKRTLPLQKPQVWSAPKADNGLAVAKRTDDLCLACPPLPLDKVTQRSGARSPTRMSDIFISYARSTEGQARQVAEALRAMGYGVWRDDEIPAHRAFSEVIEERLRASKAVVVVWSADATASEWVRSEATLARADRKLVQLSVDGTKPPMPFEQIQCADLAGWEGDASHPGWARVTASVRDLVGAASAPERPSKPAPRSLTGRLAVCVLPFANMSGDPEQEYFSDGISEDIITDLSKVSALSVVARNTAFGFKGQIAKRGKMASQPGRQPHPRR